MNVHDTQPSALAMAGISFAYGEKKVLNDANLWVQPGQIVGLLGANGAGKSTVVNIATGLLAPDRGSVRIAGHELGKERNARALLGCAPQDTGVYPALTVRENLRGFAGLYGLSRKRAQRRSEAVIAALGLESCANTPAERLSGGQRRRLHAGIALVHEPELLILDEATVGSDVQSRQQIVELVRSLAAGGAAILYTTHYLAELESMGADISVLQRGHIQHYGPVESVIACWGANEVAIRIAPERHTVALRLLRQGAIEWIVREEWLVCPAASADPTQLLAAALTTLGSGHIEVREVDIRRSSLENAYLRIISESESEQNHAAA